MEDADLSMLAMVAVLLAYIVDIIGYELAMLVMVLNIAAMIADEITK